jgi:hypothetical protein
MGRKKKKKKHRHSIEKEIQIVEKELFNETKE